MKTTGLAGTSMEYEGHDRYQDGFAGSTMTYELAPRSGFMGTSMEYELVYPHLREQIIKKKITRKWRI
jgi:hypothetical protein